jgi:hypothetical protein
MHAANKIPVACLTHVLNWYAAKGMYVVIS